MLIEFSVTNYRSINERQTLSMAASTHLKESEELNATFDPALPNDSMPHLLRSCALYGPNASGKSTLIQALQFVKTQILNSQKESQAGDEIDVVPFKLTAQSRNADSEFEVAFIEAGVRYEYGFRCNRQRFTEEWLFAYPNGRSQKWFHRVFDEQTDKDVYKFSTSFLGGRQRQLWEKQTRPNALFFSTTIAFNNEQLKPAFDWFRSRLQVLSTIEKLNPRHSEQHCLNDTQRNRIIDFMRLADLSITDIQVDLTLKEILFKEGADIYLKMKFIHRDVETQVGIEFDEEEESDGTLALFAFAGPWLDSMDNERVLVVDELDGSLHPLLVYHLVNLLHQQKNKAQLVFTTHDATLLSQKLLRRDQVWFMEKDKHSATRLYPLSDFSPRENEAIEKGYLNGRYGAIPFLKDLDFYGV